MTRQRALNAGSDASAALYFSTMALTDCASMRAWAGSYTPHGRSQCALTVVVGANRRENIAIPSEQVSWWCVRDTTRDGPGEHERSIMKRFGFAVVEGRSMLPTL